MTTLLMVTGFAFLSRLTQIARLPRGSCASVQGFASGFLPTPPHDGAVASGSELAPPLPPGDFHPQSIAHAGRTQWRPSRAVALRSAAPTIDPVATPMGSAPAKKTGRTRQAHSLRALDRYAAIDEADARTRRLTCRLLGQIDLAARSDRFAGQSISLPTAGCDAGLGPFERQW